MKKYGTIILGLLLVIASIYWFTQKEPNDPIIAEGNIITNTKEDFHNNDKQGQTKKLGQPSSYYKVFITGAIENPGVYEIDGNTTIGDVIKASGGLLPYAGVDGINLSEKVEEGSHIHIPFNFTGNPEELLRKKKININTATLDELKTLSGVGPATAERIISYRTENGPFSSIENIQKVKGIGKGIFQKLKDKITV